MNSTAEREVFSCELASRIFSWALRQRRLPGSREHGAGLSRPSNRHAGPQGRRQVMHAHVAADSRFRQLFAQEIQSLARLRHPYIVQLLDSSLNDQRGPLLVMEHIRASRWKNICRRPAGFRSPCGLAAWLPLPCAGSGACPGIIHRDLKPANLMIVGAGTLEESLRVMDFGLASFTSKPHFTTERLAGGNHTMTQGTPTISPPNNCAATMSMAERSLQRGRDPLPVVDRSTNLSPR